MSRNHRKSGGRSSGYSADVSGRDSTYRGGYIPARSSGGYSADVSGFDSSRYGSSIPPLESPGYAADTSARGSDGFSSIIDLYADRSSGGSGAAGGRDPEPSTQSGLSSHTYISSSVQSPPPLLPATSYDDYPAQSYTGPSYTGPPYTEPSYTAPSYNEPSYTAPLPATSYDNYPSQPYPETLPATSYDDYPSRSQPPAGDTYGTSSTGSGLTVPFAYYPSGVDPTDRPESTTAFDLAPIEEPARYFPTGSNRSSIDSADLNVTLTAGETSARRRRRRLEERALDDRMVDTGRYSARRRNRGGR